MNDFYYNLVTTKKGQFPVQEIKEGTEVLSHGNWVKAPKPELGPVVICSFAKQPTTAFEKKFISKKREVFCNHEPVLNAFEKAHLGLTVRGYLNLPRVKNIDSLSFSKLSDLNYWYPRVIDFFGKVVYPKIKENMSAFSFYESLPEINPLHDDELSERNLEYYLEGFLRRRMFWQDNTFKFTENMNETDKIVFRLLNIDLVEGSYAYNPVSILKHIKDDYLKSKITEDMIRILLIKSYEISRYTPGYKILSRKESEGYILPGINPDINCLSPWVWEKIEDYKNPQVKKNIRTNLTDSAGKVYKNEYRNDNLWEKIMNS